MTARELVELAALLSSHGPVIVRGGGSLLSSGLYQFWSASKFRLDEWSRAIKRHCDAHSSTPASNCSAPIRPVLEEVLAGEILTRVWTALLVAYDRRHHASDAAQIAHSTLASHAEARQRALQLIANGPGLSQRDTLVLNRLRRRCERWTDLLIGRLLATSDVSGFAFDPERARDFADDLRHESRTQVGEQAWAITLASLRAAFHQGLSNENPNAALNAQIAAGILSCLPNEVFDSSGAFASLWLMRLTNTASDAQGMIEELLGESDAVGQNPLRGRRG